LQHKTFIFAVFDVLAKGTHINKNTTFEPLRVQFGSKLQPVGWPKKGKKVGRRKSQNRYIIPPCAGAISQLICTKYGEFVDLTDVIPPAKFGSKIFINFFRRRGRKTHYALELKRPK